MFVFQPFIYYSFHILTNNISLQIWNCQVYSTIFVVSLIQIPLFFKNLKQYNMRNVTTIENDYDFQTIEKTFSGKLTKCRYKLLDRYCRRNTRSYGHCGHDYDCCGCPSSIKTNFTYKHNLVTITQTIQFNY